MHERHLRSIAKTASWRILATLATASIVFLLTNRLTLALSVGGIEAITKLILYYFHERIWNIIHWGKY